MRRLAQYAPWRGALDTFSYQGDLRCIWRRNVSSVTGVDSSRPALEMAEKNSTLKWPRSGVDRGERILTCCATTLLRDRRYDTI